MAEDHTCVRSDFLLTVDGRIPHACQISPRSSCLTWLGKSLGAKARFCCKTVLTVGVLLFNESCNIFQIWAADSKHNRYVWICDYICP